MRVHSLIDDLSMLKTNATGRWVPGNKPALYITEIYIYKENTYSKFSNYYPCFNFFKL